MNRAHALAFLALAPLLVGGCAIGDNDPLPSLGAVCTVAEGKCGIEHVCRANAPGSERGVCVPVTSFGEACDDPPPSHPPGRNGTDEDNDQLVIRNQADATSLLDEVRSVTGQVRTEPAEGGNGLAELENLCAFRNLQRVGNGIGIGKTRVVDLNGLQSLTSVQGGLAIFANPTLTSLAGLDNLAHIEPGQIEGQEFDVVIIGNENLEDEVVDPFIAALQERVGRELTVVACRNDGRECGPLVDALVDRIVAVGIGPG